MSYTFRVTVELGSDALDGDSLPGELASILRALADNVEWHGDVTEFDATLRDVNGNTVGRAHTE